MPAVSERYSLVAYRYSLPKELIAQRPTSKRDHSRLLVVDRATSSFREIPFYEIVALLGKEDRLVFNDTKVIPARLLSNCGRMEVFLCEREEEGRWIALVRPGKKLRVGAKVTFGPQFSCEILEILPDGRRRIRLHGDEESGLALYGKVPLPPYIERGVEPDLDKQRYQTIYAKNPGAIAAPTAGLHFTDQLLEKIEKQGNPLLYLTLHVGIGTFRPIECEDIRDHKMHFEHYSLSEQTAKRLKGGRLIAIGTTSCRTLEACMDREGNFRAGRGKTNLFIYPGYTFKAVQGLLTNFHLPGSTLLLLTCAFGGYELVMEAYRKAVKDRFRFYSYGDAMLIL